MEKKEESLALRKRTNNLTQFLQTNILKEVFCEYRNSREPKVLETGCGYGFFTEIVSTYCSSLYATDINDYFPLVLKKNCRIKYCKNVDAQKLPFKSNFFDVVYSMDVIEHIADDQSFINEGLRVLKKEGDLIIGTPNRKRLINLLFKITGHERKYPLCVGHSQNYDDVIHLREYTPEDILRLLQKSGYRWELRRSESLSFGLLGHLEIKCPNFLRNFCQFWLFVIRKK